MKKTAVIAGSIVAAVILAGGAYVAFSEKKPETLAVYWDGKVSVNKADAAGDTPLLKAVRSKDVPVYSYLLLKGADVDVKNKEGVSALLFALKNGDETAVKAMLPFSKADFKEPAVMSAAIDSGKADFVLEVLNKGGDANVELEFKGKKRIDDTATYTDKRVVTPLKRAVYENKPEIAKVLILHKAEGARFFLEENLKGLSPQMFQILADAAGDLNEIVVKNTDLLSYLANEGDVEILRYLVRKGTGDLNRAFMRVLVSRKADNKYDETVKMFLEEGALVTPEFLQTALKKRRQGAFEAMGACGTKLDVMTEKDGSLLFYATANGYTEGVEYLLDKGLDMWGADENGETPVLIAIKQSMKYPETAKIFEEHFKGVDDAGYDGVTPLMLYARFGQDKGFFSLVEKGADVRAKDNTGRNLLMYAAEGGNEKIMDYLLYKGVSVSQRDDLGRTAVMYAAGAGQDEAFMFLRDRGAVLNDQDEQGKTVVMYAAEKSSPEVIHALLARGESLNVTDKDGKSVVMYAAENGNMEVLKELLDRGVDFDEADKDGMTALGYAAKGGHTSAVKLLVDRGADVYMANNQGEQPVYYAAESGNLEMFRLLNRPYMSYKDRSDGKTVYMAAAIGGNTKLLEELIRTETSSLTKRDNDGRTFLMYLVATVRPDFLRSATHFAGSFAAADNEGKTVLMYAAESLIGVNMVTILSGLKNSEILAVDKSGRNALMYELAAPTHQLVKAHMLLNHDIDVNETDKNGKNALMYALSNQFVKMDQRTVEELLSGLTNINAADKNGKTALMYAAENPEIGLVITGFLLEKGAAVNKADKNGKTALMYAAESGDIGKVRMLLKQGADAKLADKAQRTVADYAKKGGSCLEKAILAQIAQ